MDHSSVDHSATTGDSIDPYQKLNGALSVDYSEATMPLPAPASGAGDGAAYGLAAGQAIDASTMMTPDALIGDVMKDCETNDHPHGNAASEPPQLPSRSI